MILAIDIGNSTIGFGFLKDGKVERVSKIENIPDSELFRPKLENFFEAVAERHMPTKVIICSVVPKSLRHIQRKVRKYLGLKALIVGRQVKIPIKNKYRHPLQVGKDRLLCAFAARELYGAPAVVIDLGTAITFDGVSAKGEYLGGAIIPGLRLSAEALFEKTALLPRVRIAEPGKVIGRSTEESIQSGLFHGYGALCDGMIERLGQEMNCKPKVVMTGGYSGVLSRFMKHPIAAVDEELIFKGIGLLATPEN
jgi:type III pantothenate kinase